MTKVNIDWSDLGFSYQPITKRYVADYKDGKWGKGGLTEDANVVINECAGILQYCQEVFEGLKAYKTKDGKIVTFRPDLNAERMIDSAKRLVMPPVSKEMFLEAVDQVVEANVLDCGKHGLQQLEIPLGAGEQQLAHDFASAPSLAKSSRNTGKMSWGFAMRFVAKFFRPRSWLEID